MRLPVVERDAAAAMPTQSGTGGAVMGEVALELWGPRDNLYEKRLALQEGLAHLQALAVEGRLTKSVTPQAVLWSQAEDSAKDLTPPRF